MNPTSCQINLSAYLSGAALGAAVLVMLAAPHVKLEVASAAEPVAACAAHVSQAQVAVLRGVVIDAEDRRGALLRGPSAYAAAKVGLPPDRADAWALKAADADVAKARAQFAAGCA